MRFEHSVCRGSLMTTYIYIYTHTNTHTHTHTHTLKDEFCVLHDVSAYAFF